MRTSALLGFLGLLLCSGAGGTAHAQDWKLLFDLRGQWKFSIGDDMRRARPGFDDSQWESIYAPAAWEDEGFPGYDGYGWYRKHFRSDASWNGKMLFLHCGVIDDVDEVYVNGHLIGSTGSFPPDYSTAYAAERIYALPSEYCNPGGDNVVAIRVYDDELSGGILRGKLGVYEDRSALQLEQQITIGWKFRTGDDPGWKDPSLNDAQWAPIHVPATWESQGYPGYDGFAWYRIGFTLTKELRDRRIVLVLGKIDDFDEVYLNGVMIGHTGSMKTRQQDIPGSDAYTKLRAYTVPTDLLHQTGENVIAVRVYDGFKDGGIYSGPVGLTTRENYLRWYKQTEPVRHWFDWLFR